MGSCVVQNNLTRAVHNIYISFCYIHMLQSHCIYTDKSLSTVKWKLFTLYSWNAETSTFFFCLFFYSLFLFMLFVFDCPASAIVALSFTVLSLIFLTSSFYPAAVIQRTFFIVILQWDAVVVDTSVSFTSSVNSRWPGLVLCFSLLRALCRHLTSAISLILRWCAPTIFWVVLIKRCRAFLSWAVPLYLSFPSLNSEDVSEGLIQIWEMNAGNGKLHAACVFLGGGVKMIISHYSATKMVELTAVQSKVQWSRVL